MLKRLGEEKVNPSVKITEAKFPAPFVSGLEYGAPARGTWNIVHVGMLIPGAHQIFACAQGCLRGVVLTAAEMNASDRFSTIAIRENNVLDGDMEDLLIEGVSDILERLPEYPPAILLYTSCIHHFMGSDLNYVYKVLRERYPQVQFTDCYMNPIMRKSGLTPDQTMRRQLYSLLTEKNTSKREKRVHIAGCDFPLDKKSELYTCLQENGYEVCEIATCKTYEEYQQLADCSAAITTFPAAKVAGEYLGKNHGQKHLYLPASFSYEKIEENLKQLQETLGISLDEAYLQKKKAACEEALQKAREIIGDTEITIDFTAFPFILSLTKLLVTHGFHVTKLYTDSFPGEEKEIFAWLQEHAPELEIYPTVHASMRVLPRKNEEKILAIGQKAAYFSGTEYFVNVVEGGGFWGYEAIIRLAELMCEAFETPKDTKALIQIKGMGCGSCV
ncbi:MAG: nitrogenase component 1 [Ruminococcus sp.]|nr:nitrogenase component 1 [Ruminococcus sp.]